MKKNLKTVLTILSVPFLLYSCEKDDCPEPTSNNNVATDTTIHITNPPADSLGLKQYIGLWHFYSRNCHTPDEVIDVSFNGYITFRRMHSQVINRRAVFEGSIEKWEIIFDSEFGGLATFRKNDGECIGTMVQKI